MIEFTREGVSVDTFNEIVDRIVAGLKVAYGEDITVDQDSPDGQSIGIQAKGDLDLQSFLLALYSNLDPDFASGAMLDVILKISGLTKRPATKSTVDITVTTDRPVTLPIGYKVKDLTDQEWETELENVLPFGVSQVTFTASKWGAIEAPPNTITEPVTIILGVVSVTNPLAATVGNDEETEAQVRIRRNKSLENPAYSTIGAIVSKLIGLDGVIDVKAYENKTDVQDVVRDIAPHTQWLIVDGGDVSEIIKNIAIQKTTGCDTKGDVSGQYAEEFTRGDGSTFTYTHTVEFDRPAPTSLYVTGTAKRKVSGEPVDTVAIENAIKKRIFYIADNVQAAELYQQGYQAGSNYILSDFMISLDDVVYTDEELFSGHGGLFEFATVVITEVL